MARDHGMDEAAVPDLAPLTARLVANPAAFLVPDPTLAADLFEAARSLFALLKRAEPVQGMGPLDELIVDGFDAEGVWEQIKLLNEPMLEYLKERVELTLESGDIKEDHEMGDQDEVEDEEGDEEMHLSDEAFDEDADLEDYDMPEDIDLNEEEDEEEEEEEAEAEADGDGEEPLDSDLEGEGEEDGEDAAPERKGRVTEIDDAFFSVDEMERFADRAEERDSKGGVVGDDWDLGEGFLGMDPDELDGSDDEDVANANEIRYADFFDPPSKEPNWKAKKGGISFSDKVQERRFDRDEPPETKGVDKERDEDADVLDGDGEGDEDEDGDLAQPKTASDLFAEEDEAAPAGAKGKLSRFEREQERLRKQVAALEAEALGPAPWELRGEVSSKARPVNSLIEADLEIERASRPAPVVTEETTATLEDLIKSRIKESLFDDVERRLPKKEKVFDPNRQDIIREEKSSVSLAQEYESEYLKQTTGATATARDEKLKAAHDEIEGLMSKLFTALDGLSNWHFAPGAPKAELEVVAVNVPALTIEEVTPAAVSDAALAAPEEVFAPPTVAKGEAELTAADKRKLRERQKKKVRKDKARRAAEDKARMGVQAGSGVVKGAKSASAAKAGALQALAKKSNVTIVADGKRGSGSAKEAQESKGKGKSGKAIRAQFVERGGKVGGGVGDAGSSRPGTFFKR